MCEYEDALHLLVSRRPVQAVDVTGLPWTEVDFVEDLRRAQVEVFPEIVRLESRMSGPDSDGHRGVRGLLYLSASEDLEAGCASLAGKPVAYRALMTALRAGCTSVAVPPVFRGTEVERAIAAHPRSRAAVVWLSGPELRVGSGAPPAHSGHVDRPDRQRSRPAPDATRQRALPVTGRGSRRPRGSLGERATRRAPGLGCSRGAGPAQRARDGLPPRRARDRGACAPSRRRRAARPSVCSCPISGPPSIPGSTPPSIAGSPACSPGAWWRSV